MKKLLTLGLLLLASAALAAKPNLPADRGGQKLQGLAPDARKGSALGVASVTVDMTDDVGYTVYVPGSGCKFRTMSTATRAGNQRTVPAGAWLERRIGAGSAFINFSGCTSGELQRQ